LRQAIGLGAVHAERPDVAHDRILDRESGRSSAEVLRCGVSGEGDGQTGDRESDDDQTYAHDASRGYHSHAEIV